MIIVEYTFTVNKNGCLKIPPHVISEMGLWPGSCVRISYLSSDGAQNDFREFVLSKSSIQDLDMTEEQKIIIPEKILLQCNIQSDADLQVGCFDGFLLIAKDTGLTLEELSAVISKLNAANQLIPGESEKIEIESLGKELGLEIYSIQERNALQ